jgi:hypothetical protein
MSVGRPSILPYAKIPASGNSLCSESSISWSSYWKAQSNFYELWKVTGAGTMIGLKRGDELTITGSGLNAIYAVPDTAPYITADTDKIWFNTVGIRRTATHAELVGYDLPRTFIKYSDTFVYPNGLIGVYNGCSQVGHTDYAIGLVNSLDGITFNRDAHNPILSKSVAGWDQGGVAHPTMVIVDGVMYVYYSGWTDLATKQIGLATSDDYGQTWTRYGSAPVIALGAASDFDDTTIFGPFVLYDTSETDSTKRWKMWYCGTNGVITKVGYAYSSDGLTWTKSASNPVFSGTGAATWDKLDVGIGCVIKKGSVFNAFYFGLDNDGVTIKDGLLTFTDPEGTYTKSVNNPVLSPRNAATQALTANLTTGNKIVTVADSSVFLANEFVILYDNNSVAFLARIATIDSSTQITLDRNVDADYTTAQSALIQSVYYSNPTIQGVYYNGSKWVALVTCYFGTFLREYVMYAESDTFDGVYTFNMSKGLVLEPDAGSTWDNTSMENIKTQKMTYIPSTHTAATFAIDEIIILKAGETLTTAELNFLRTYCNLSVYWNDVLSSLGAVKTNRVESQSVWIPETIYTKSLLHFEGANASVVFTDETGKIWTPAADAKISTTQKKFGSASGLFDGTGDVITTPDHADFAFGSGDFTIDFWVYHAGIGSTVFICGQSNAAADVVSRSIEVYINGTNKLLTRLWWGSGGTDTSVVLSTGSVNPGELVHIAVARSGNTFTQYINGVPDGTVSLAGKTLNDSDTVFTIGGLGAYTGQRYNGYIDEFRLSKGKARWTADFSASLPAAPYTLIN